MRKKKRMVTVLLLVLLACAMVPQTALAAGETRLDDASIQPKSSALINCSLVKYSSTQMKLVVSVSLNYQDTISISAQLQRYQNGQWVNVGIPYMTTTYGMSAALIRYPAPEKGYTYRVKAIVTPAKMGSTSVISPTLAW